MSRLVELARLDVRKHAGVVRLAQSLTFVASGTRHTVLLTKKREHDRREIWTDNEPPSRGQHCAKGSGNCKQMTPTNHG